MDSNYVVFFSSDAYVIMAPFDARKLPAESVTDVSISNVCYCKVIDEKPLGNNLNDVILVSNVEFKYQNI